MSAYPILPLLGPAEEAELARRVHGDDAEDALAARNELVLHNLGLVGTAAAWAKRRYGGDYDDLFSEGVIALVRAAEGFDPEKHLTRFSTYAVPGIRNRLRDYVLETRHTVSVPNYLQSPKSLKWARERVADRPNLAAKLERNVADAERAVLPFAPIGSGSGDVADGSTDALASLIQRETAERVTAALGELKPLRAYVLAYRMGLCDLERRNRRSLGRELGLTKERVRQIEKLARADMSRVLAPQERACA